MLPRVISHAAVVWPGRAAQEDGVLLPARAKGKGINCFCNERVANLGALRCRRLVELAGRRRNSVSSTRRRK